MSSIPLCFQATMERQEAKSRSEMTQVDAERSQLRQQVADLKETLANETRTSETERNSLSRQLELVRSLILAAF